MTVVATVGGTPRARGRAHGEELRPLVCAGIERWLDALAGRVTGSPGDHVAALVAETGFEAAARRWTPGLLDEVEGIAEGAGVARDLVVAYQLADEEWWWSAGRGPAASPDGEACSVLAVRPAPGRPAPIMGQNMDLPAHFDSTQAVLRIEGHGEPGAVVLTAAGYLGFTGCNAAGIAVCVNTLLELPRSTEGLPVAFVVRALLACRDLDEAAALVRSVPHASGQNYLLGGPGGVVDVEAGAGVATRHDPPGPTIAHTNHALAVGPGRQAGGRAPAGNSLARLRHLERRGAAVAEAEGTNGIETVLAEAPLCVGRRPARPSMTFGAVAFELTVPPTCRVATGPPDVTAFEPVGVPAGVSPCS